MRPNKRSGFTLIETIVALVLLQIGMLALAATAGVAARDLSDALIRRRAAAIARSRADWLRASACSASETGMRPLGRGMVEYWRVEAQGRVRAVVDSVSVMATRGRRLGIVARSWVLCA